MQEDETEELALAETGDLANVVLRQGRAVGTLGHEEEMRKLRRQLIPKRVGQEGAMHKPHRRLILGLVGHEIAMHVSQPIHLTRNPLWVRVR